MLFQDFVNFLIEWIKTRRWRKLITCGFIIAILPLVAICVIIYGFSIPTAQLASNCLSAADGSLSELEISKEPAVDESDGEIQVALRRILQIGAFNERVTYVVASQLGRQGRIAMAAKMMRDIAPSDGEGFPEAHRWISSYTMTLGKNKKLDKAALKNDLKIAVESASTVTALHVGTLAQILASEGKTEEAAAIVRSRKLEFPELKLYYAELAQKLGDSGEYREAIKEAKQYVDQKFTEGKASVTDVMRLVQLAMLEKDIDRALATAQAAVNKQPEEPLLRRLFSEVLCAKYQSLEQEPGRTSLGERLQYLDMALKVDPSNPMVVGEVAKAMESGQSMTKELKEALETSLADGNAPTVVHMVIANGKLGDEEPEKAIPHLELALRQSPNSGIVKNNLAYALLKSRPTELGRAEELVTSALTSPGITTQMAASMLDTQGQIREEQSDAIGAIESYEKAIKLDAEKLNTRKRLVRLYQSVGMEDLAAAQQRRIGELENKPKDSPASDG